MVAMAEATQRLFMVVAAMHSPFMAAARMPSTAEVGTHTLSMAADVPLQAVGRIVPPGLCRDGIIRLRHRAVVQLTGCEGRVSPRTGGPGSPDPI